MNTPINTTPEAIALAAGILTQAKGDLSLARRMGAEAAAWLASVDPSYKPAPAAVADDTIAAERDTLRQRLATVTCERDALQRQLDGANTAERDLREQLTRLTAERKVIWDDLTKITADRDYLLGQLGCVNAPGATPAPAPAQPQAPTAKPVKYAPAPAAPAAPAADPFAGLPPKMRAFLQAQQGGKGLEID